MKMLLAPRVGAFVKIAGSLALIVFLLSRLHCAELIERLTRAHPLWLFFALALYFGAIFLGILKWHLLVRAQRLAVSFWDLTTFTFTGLFLSNVLPSNVGGDIVRAVMLARGGTGSAETAAISVVVDRWLGLIAFLGVTLVSAALAVACLPPSAEMESLRIAMVAATVVCAVGSALFFSRRAARSAAAIFQLRPLARFKPRARRVDQAIQMYRANIGALAGNIALSAGILVVTTLVWYSVARALDLDISILYFFLFNPLIAFVLLLPISLNGLGAKEATAVFFFGLVGVPGESAFAMSLLFHAIIVLTSLPGGGLWWRQRPRLRASAPVRIGTLDEHGSR